MKTRKSSSRLVVSLCCVRRLRLLLLLLLLLVAERTVALIHVPAHVDLSDSLSLSSDEFAPTSNLYDLSSCAYFPQLVCVGVQKAATTTLHAVLSQCLPMCYTKKELHVLDQAQLNDVLAQEHVCERYKRAFDVSHIAAARRRKAQCWRIEITPSNAVFRTPATTFVESRTPVFVILRDPLARLVSAFNMRIKRGQAASSAENAGDSNNNCEAARLRNVALFQEQLLHELRDASKSRRPWLTSFDNGNVNITLMRSLYDRVLHLYRGTLLRVLWFEDVVSCSDRFIADLREMLDDSAARTRHSNVTDAQLECLRRACAGTHVNAANADACANVRIDDIPRTVVQFVQQHNTWFYEARRTTQPHFFEVQNSQ